MKREIELAVEFLREGKLVGIPTETVYGLGADAKNPAALQKIFKAKGRPSDHPLIVHIGNIAELSAWAIDIPEPVYRLAQVFWPGPLTFILKKAPGVHDLITGGQNTIGIRIPNHPMALALLHEFGSGIAAPSANRFGKISPTTTAAVREELGDAVDYVLEGGSCTVGLESTIIDFSSHEPTILRPGMISATQIEKVLNHSLTSTKKNVPRVSGSLESHYAPETPIILVSTDKIRESASSAILQWSDIKTNMPSFLMSNDPKQYAHDIYEMLRTIDKKNFSKIIIEAVPDGIEWDGIRDRLLRAARK